MCWPLWRRSLVACWREDEPVAGLERAAALKNAPLARHNQFAVPKVVE